MSISKPTPVGFQIHLHIHTYPILPTKGHIFVKLTYYLGHQTDAKYKLAWLHKHVRCDWHSNFSLLRAKDVFNWYLNCPLLTVIWDYSDTHFTNTATWHQYERRDHVKNDQTWHRTERLSTETKSQTHSIWHPARKGPSGEIPIKGSLSLQLQLTSGF